MIQRKQSLWLLLAALFAAGVLCFDIYKAEHQPGTPGTDAVLRTAGHYPSLIMAVVMIVLPIITIFMFKDRKRQRNMTLVSILANIGFVAIQLSRVLSLDTITNTPYINGHYGLGAIFPVFSIVLLILAILGIRKDDKLVKSMDRLR